MADNTTLNSMTGGDTIAADDIAGVKHQRVKISVGADGSATDLSSANPMPIGAPPSLPLPSGAATAANQSTIIGHIDGIEGLLTTIDADTGAISSYLATIAGAIAATEMQVDVVGALPAGDNNIGNVDIASAIPAGDNNIGNVDIASIAAGDNNIGNVDIVTQPARDRTTDNQGVALQTDAIMNDTTALTPKFAIIDAATSGNNTLIAAVTSKKIRVLAVYMVAAAAVYARFESGADGTALSGQMNLAANGGFVLPFNPVGWFETASNTLLNLELSAANSVDGSIVYVEV